MMDGFQTFMNLATQPQIFSANMLKIQLAETETVIYDLEDLEGDSDDENEDETSEIKNEILNVHPPDILNEPDIEVGTYCFLTKESTKLNPGVSTVLRESNDGTFSNIFCSCLRLLLQQCSCHFCNLLVRCSRTTGLFVRGSSS